MKSFSLRCFLMAAAFLCAGFAQSCSNPREFIEDLRDPDKETDKALEEERNYMLLMLFAWNSQTCESSARGNVVQLSENVSYGPVTGNEDVCFVVSTSQARTIKVTTNGTEDVNIILWVPSNGEITSGFMDDPTLYVNAAYNPMKFLISSLVHDTYSVIVQ